MKNFFKSTLITSILLLVLGLLLIFESENTITTISYIIGAILVAAGTFAFIRYMRNNKNGFEISELDILYGVVSIILGVLVIKNPHVIASIIPIILGIAIIISSAMKIQYAIDLKNNNNDLWKTTLVIAIISTVCGVALLFNPFAGAVFIMRIVGIFIVVYSILDIVSTFIIKKNVVSFNSYIETNDNKVKEAEIVEEEESPKNKPKKTRKKKSKTDSESKSK